ncbi:hypothetical protein [Spirillospora sp. NPDC047279]|uniref:hypothetical protein n=1 Tax=Spirillospora sp. NPDC047279 TaxID=3155478 RepID=UPI0033C24333
MDPSCLYRPLTVDDVVRVAVHPDRRPTHQAKVIAFAYHRLAHDLARHLGRDVNNWYCYAVWASKAVGENLDLTRESLFLKDVGTRLNVPDRLRRPFRRTLLALLGPSYQLALALANRAIFLEMGSLAAELWGAGEDYSIRVREARRPVRRPEILSSLLAPAEEDLLDIVVRLYTKARNTADPAGRAELVLGANVALVAYEQQRAQRLLELILNRPPRWVLQASWRWVWSAVTRRPFRRLAIYTAPHADQPWPVRKAERRWARFYTHRLMVMRTPLGRIQLGRPLPPPAGVDPETAWAPIRDPEVRALVERFLPADFERATAGVGNWLRFEDRMRFIVAYFRMYSAVPGLFDPPFGRAALDELVDEMNEGRSPEPLREWRQREDERRHGGPARGVRGLIVRQLYRSPFHSDPDAAELAGLDLEAYAHRRPLRPEAGPVSPGTPAGPG